MIDPLQVQTSRRSALKRMGLVGGAAAAGLVSNRESAPVFAATSGFSATDNASGNERATGDVPQAVPAITPGLTYATYGMFGFQPNLFANGYSVSGTGCYCSTSDGYVVANLELPTGAIVKEIYFAGQNSSGAPASFFVERYPLDGGGSQPVADVLIPTGGATIQNRMVTVDHVVDPGYSYDAAGFTSSAIRMYGCRIGFAGPFGFFPLTPQVRKLDTRLPGPLTGKIGVGQTRTLALTPDLPAGATAALFNITVTETVDRGFLGLFPAGTPFPGTSSINWSATGQTVGNNATVAVSAGGAVSIFCGGVSGRAHVIVDLVGYLG